MMKRKLILFTSFVFIFAAFVTGCSDKTNGDAPLNSSDTQTEEATTTEEVTETTEEPLTEADIELNGIPYEELTPEQVVELDYMYWNSQDGRRLEVIETNANADLLTWVVLKNYYLSVLTSRHCWNRKLRIAMMF